MRERSHKQRENLEDATTLSSEIHSSARLAFFNPFASLARCYRLRKEKEVGLFLKDRNGSHRHSRRYFIKRNELFAVDINRNCGRYLAVQSFQHARRIKECVNLSFRPKSRFWVGVCLGLEGRRGSQLL